ncbi:precorrin-6A reductase [Clostridium cellulovorans]|uniref:Precorrin-6x reductase n=1 Tax=Clostridium cellulovorans (strain ATCC 35296 / DSM 3052 / OCM 3 / 743B) TaxID=573061 RepID=D9SNZ9_CLOC7|nr:precorrin-6A reductase [Clostridium cellulovorans]ADL51964.1 precorrin-6x reductase [Clostridium cellulovorans 743B]
MLKNAKTDIIIIAGTTEARELIESLEKYNISILATVATEMGAQALKGTNAEIYENRLDYNGFVKFFTDRKPSCVIDASHPFADIVSKNVKAACAENNIKYIRYQRPKELYEYEKIILAKDSKDAALKAKNIEGNILLTTGVKTLEDYMDLIDDFFNRVFVRILDNKTSIDKCKGLGIQDEHVFSLSPPFSTEDNINLIKRLNAKAIVTKDSGKAGAIEEKILAAKAMDIPVILIQRPADSGVGDLDEVIRWATESL